MAPEPSRKPLEWYDVKTKFKKIIRSIGYSSLVQELISLITYSYANLVFYTSKKKYQGLDKLTDFFVQNKSCAFCLWHSNILMMMFIVKIVRKINPSCQFFALASRHGDGQFAGRVVEKFGADVVLGSSKGHRKSSRGIDIASFKKIFEEIKLGKNFVITPDGPRGPRNKINGHVVDIAKKGGIPLLPCGYSASRKKILNSWDKFILPLPFSVICYDFGDLIYVNQDVSKEDVEKFRLLLEEEINASNLRAENSFHKAN